MDDGERKGPRNTKRLTVEAQKACSTSLGALRQPSRKDPSGDAGRLGEIYTAEGWGLLYSNALLLLFSPSASFTQKTLKPRSKENEGEYRAPHRQKKNPMPTHFCCSFW